MSVISRARWALILSPIVYMIFRAIYFPDEMFCERHTSPEAPELIMFTSLSVCKG